MYCNDWFEGRQAIRALPTECVSDIARPGPADEAVEHWVERLSFEGPAWLIREHLSGYGAWDRTDLCDHEENRKRVLWIWACNCAEYPGDYDYLYLE